MAELYLIRGDKNSSSVSTTYWSRKDGKSMGVVGVVAGLLIACKMRRR